MVKKYWYLIILFFLLSSCNSCKNVDQSNNVPSVNYLSYYQWHLISITNSNTSIPRYAGTKADSLRFTWKWAHNGDVLLDSIFYYESGYLNKYSGNFLFDTSNNSYIDTIKCNPAWKTGYSNSLIIRSIANNILVFTVINNNNTEIETDSLTGN